MKDFFTKHWEACLFGLAVLWAAMMLARCAQLEMAKNLAHDAVELSTLKVKREANAALIEAQEKLINEQEREEERLAKLREEISSLRKQLRRCKSDCSPLKKRLQAKARLLNALTQGPKKDGSENAGI